MVRTLIAVLVLWSVEALACSCARTTAFFPDRDAVVPTNVAFQITANLGSVPAFSLFIAGSDQAIPLDVTTHHPGWITLKPREPLKPNSSYSLVGADQLSRANYTTGAGADEVPPEPRTITKTTRTFIGNRGTCGSAESIELAIDGPGEPDTAFFLFAGDAVDSKSLVGDATAFTSDAVLFDNSCGINIGLRARPDLALAIRVVDFAGNVSELSSAKQAKTAGCSSAPALLGMLGVFALVLRRKRFSA